MKKKMGSTLQIMRRRFVSLTLIVLVAVTAVYLCGCRRESDTATISKPKITTTKVAKTVSQLHRDEFWRPSSLRFIWSAGLVSRPEKALVTDKYLLVIDENHMVYAIDRSEKGRGVVRWRVDIGQPIDNITASQNEVMVLCKDWLYRISDKDGNVIWSKKINFVASSDVVRGQAAICVAGYGKRVYGLDLVTCLPVWETKTKENIVGKIVDLGARIYGVTEAGHLYAFNGHNGKEEWHLDLETKVLPGLTADKTAVYVPSWDSVLYAYSRYGEGMQWLCRTKGPVTTMPLVAGGWIFFQADNDGFYAVHSRGKPKWRLDGKWVALGAGKKYAYLLQEPDTIVTVEKNTGKECNSLKLSNFTLFPQNSLSPEIFCISVSGEIMALQESY